MIELELEHRIDCSPEEYWRTTFDPAFCSAFFIGKLHYKHFAITLNSGELTHGVMLRNTEAEPSGRGVPAWAKRGLAYVQTGALTVAENRYAFRTFSRAYPKLVDISGEMQLTIAPPPTWVDDGVASYRRTRICLGVRVFGAALVEPLMVQTIRRSFDESATFVNLYLRQRRESLARVRGTRA
jgi:hypothetical protein